MRRSSLIKTVAGIGILALGACSDSSGPDSHPVSLSFSSQATSPAVVADRAPNFDVTVTVGVNTLVITKAQLVIRRLQLERSTATSCPDDDATRPECAEMKTGPILVDLPLTATASSAVTASVPEGTYSRIQFKIHKPTSTPADAAFVTANPSFANTSIRVEGTYNGSPFVFTSTITENIQLTFTPPVVIDADNQNVTVQVDLGNWFKVGGTLIDPTTANPGQPNAQAVTANIRASLRAFEDDDRNGT
jgi:hypothetical protein